MRFSTGLAVALVVFIAAAPARSAVIAVATNTQPSQATDDDKHALPLDEAGHTTLSVGMGGVIVFTFSAECQAQGPNGSYVSINIVVDGHPVNPASKDDFAFCSPSGANDQAYVAAVRVSTYDFRKPRVHNIQVFAKGIGSTEWRIDDSTLVVEE